MMMLILLRCPTGPGFFIAEDSMEKVFSTTEAQIEMLKARGMVIQNAHLAKERIELENYYKLINGYKELFLDPSCRGREERYLPGTAFEEVYALYLFDRELRNLFIRYILEIENNIKSMQSVTGMLNEGMTCEEIALKALDGLNPNVLDDFKVEYRCDCSRERVKTALASLGEKELSEMAENENTEVLCHFCGKAYNFSKQEIEEMIKR